MAKINEREVAVYALMDIVQEGGYNNIVLKKTLDRYGAMENRQKGFVTETVNGSLRNLIYIDYVIGQFSKTPVKKIKPFILSLLRITVYQMQFMDKVPVSAAVNEAVNLARKKGFSTLSGYVNGVLRSVARAGRDIELPSWEKEPLAHLSIKYSYPMWIMEYWHSFMTPVEIKELCVKNSIPPHVTLCANTLKITRKELADMLMDQGLQAEESAMSPRALRVKGGAVHKTEAFESGLFHVMDGGAIVAAEALGAQPGETVYDVCAAPGGKSFCLGYIMENKGRIVSYDVYPHKLELVRRNAERLGIDIIETAQGDMGIFNGALLATADRVLVDAPCSGLGLIRKKPDIKYTKTPADIDKLVETQRAILVAVQGYVKPGGVLVYSTCTISQRENEENVAWFMAQFDFTLDAVDCVGETGEEKKNDGYIHLLPHIHDTDGFFIARLRKRGANG